MAKAGNNRMREHWLRLALRIELISVVWVVIEAVASAAAALQGGSLALSAFSIDSGIELISGIVLLFRLYAEVKTRSGRLADGLERIAAGVVGAGLFTLAGWIAYESGRSLASAKPVQINFLGLAIAVLSSVITPWLARYKRQIGVQLISHALIGDAACSATCGYMAWTLLAGLLLQWMFGWWWVDPVAALGIVYFVTREAWESAISAWTGALHLHEH